MKKSDTGCVWGKKKKKTLAEFCTQTFCLCSGRKQRGGLVHMRTLLLGVSLSVLYAKYGNAAVNRMYVLQNSSDSF